MRTLAFCSFGATDALLRLNLDVSLGIRWDTPSKVGDVMESNSIRFSRVNALDGVRGAWSCCTRSRRRASLSSSRIAAVAESSDVIPACIRTLSLRPEEACWRMDGVPGLGGGASSADDRTEPTLFPPVAVAEVVKEERDDFTTNVHFCLSVGVSDT